MQRVRYAEDHWSRVEATAENLDRYLAANETAYNRTKARLFIAACQPPGGRLLLSTQNSWSLNYLIEGAYRRWWCGERDWMGWDPPTCGSIRRSRWRGCWVKPDT